MKKYLLILTLALMPLSALYAQNIPASGEEAERAGTEIQIDSALFGKDIFSVLPENVVIRQSPEVRSALNGQIELNSGKTVSGYRIRLFLDSRRTAREASLEVMTKFNSLYPNIPVYRTFSAPNFKVSAGNLRTRVEAEMLLKVLKPDFPDAFIVRDRFRYPSLGRPDLSRPEPEPEPEFGTEIEIGGI